MPMPSDSVISFLGIRFAIVLEYGHKEVCIIALFEL